MRIADELPKIPETLFTVRYMNPRWKPDRARMCDAPLPRKAFIVALSNADRSPVSSARMRALHRLSVKGIASMLPLRRLAARSAIGGIELGLEGSIDADRLQNSPRKKNSTWNKRSLRSAAHIMASEAWHSSSTAPAVECAVAAPANAPRHTPATNGGEAFSIVQVLAKLVINM